MSFQPKYLLPNGVTMVSMLLGLASAASASSGQFELAGWMIMWATLLDKVDGALARRLNATSKLGAELDSFADFVAFGIAPAALVYFGLEKGAFWQGWTSFMLIGCCAVFVVAAAVRLARFNVETPELGATHFIGVPTTIVAAVLSSLWVTLGRHELLEPFVVAMPFLLVVAAISMVSGILMPKLGRSASRVVNFLQACIVISVYLLAPLRLFPEYLLGVALTFLAAGLLFGALNGTISYGTAASRRS